MFTYSIEDWVEFLLKRIKDGKIIGEQACTML